MPRLQPSSNLGPNDHDPGFVQTIAASKRGGIQQVSAGYAAGFHDLGRELTSLVSLPPDLHRDYVYAGSRLTPEPGIGSPWKPLDVRAVSRVRSSAWARSAAGFIAHNGHTIRFLQLCRRRGQPIIAVCHMEKLGRRLEADVVLCLTAAQKDLALQQLGARIHRKLVAVVGNPLTLPPLRGPTHVADRRLRRPRLVIGTLSNLEDRKGLDTLLRALQLMRGHGLDAGIIFGGVGTRRTKLSELAVQLGVDQHVTFAGHVEDRDAFFAKLDIFCMPSRVEPFGLALIEAMSRALPVCASATEGPAEIISSERTGLLFRVDDAGELARQLIRLAENRAWARSLAIEAEARIRARYSPSVVVERICSVVARYRAGLRGADGEA